MLFGKDKKRDAARGRKPEGKAGKRPAPKENTAAPQHRRQPEDSQRRRPQGEQPRRRPPVEGEQAVPEQRRRRPPVEEQAAPEQRRRRPPMEEQQAAPEQRRRRPPVEEQTVPEQRRRRPPMEEEQAVPEQRRRRPPMEEQQAAPEQRRRRPPEEEQQAAPEQRRRRPPMEEQQAAPEQRRRRPPMEEQQAAPQEPRRRPAPVNQQSAPQEQRRKPAENPDDRVYRMENAPRKNASARRPAQKKAKPRHGSSMLDNLPVWHFNARPSVKDEPQGTSYERHTARARKPMFKFLQKPNAGKDPELVADEARMKMLQRENADEKKKRPALFDTPAIVYTQPKPFNRARLLVQLVTVLSVACAFVLALSIFFKVEVITVSGADTYSPWSVREASGIMEGDNLLTFGRARASGQITANLPYVESVRIGIKLPNTVNIEIQELDVAYSIKSGDGDWWLITSEGKVVEQITEGTAKNYTKVLGVTIDKPIVGEQAYAVEQIPDATTESGEPVPVTVTGAQRLRAALEILTALENNDIVGDAASVNVTDLDKIELWYGQRYQVNLGDESRLEEKVDCMYDVILQLSDYQTGMLDVSFTKKADQVIYTPFV